MLIFKIFYFYKNFKKNYNLAEKIINYYNLKVID